MQKSGWFPVSHFSSGDAGRDLWAEQPGWNVRRVWDLLTCDFCSAGVVGFLFIFFLICLQRHLYMGVWGRGWCVVGGYWVSLSCCKIRCLLSRQVSIYTLGWRWMCKSSRASARGIVSGDGKRPDGCRGGQKCSVFPNWACTYLIYLLSCS